MNNYIQKNNFGVEFVTAKVYELAHSHINSEAFSSFCVADPAVDYEKAMNEFDARASIKNLDILPEIAGRLCYMSFGKGRKTNEEYLDHILSVGHGSVLEHGSISFLITGISRSLSHEFVRHRAGWAYSQLSQRYVDSKDVRFIIPPAILLLSKEDQEVFLKDCAANLQLYGDLAKKLADQIKKTYSDMSITDRRKYGRGAARSILPNCTETKMVATCNIRALRHFIEMRANPAADVEIRNLAIKMFLIGKELAPNLFNDYEEIKMDDGSIALETKTRKV